MNIDIKLKKTSKVTCEQNFHFFSEADWSVKKKEFPTHLYHFFSGKKNETAYTFLNDEVHFMIGLGKDRDLPNLQAIATKFSCTHKDRIKAVPTKIFGLNNPQEMEQIILGLYLGTYHYPFDTTHQFYQEGWELNVDDLNPETIDEIILNTAAICEGQFTAMDLLNKPANFKNADLLSQFLIDLSKEKNLDCTVLNREKCAELGLGAYLSVNQGSAKDAAFTIIKYNCGNPEAKTIGLVGKCVIFDTGGISIKGSQNMHYMKSDMGGATAVIGALISASKLKTPINIVAILPITDNAVSRDAYLPSDVITAYNGKTIEVLNTDAEGRMTLADGLSYLTKNYDTDAIIDIATLTGSTVRMFGDTCGALFSNSEELIKRLTEVGNATNQRLWNLPLWDIWDEELKSDVADFKNISMKPIGDAIVAAKFLQHFINDHPNWAHLDIAGVAFGNVHYAKEKAATGYGVQLLLKLFESFK